MISCYCDNTSDMQVVKNPIVGMLTDVSDIDFGNTLLAIKSYITFLWSHPFKFNANFYGSRTCVPYIKNAIYPSGLFMEFQLLIRRIRSIFCGRRKYASMGYFCSPSSLFSSIFVPRVSG